jgi:tetratricopeptide (TPR) repeat protein
MNAAKIQNALGLLTNDPDNESAWDDVEEIVTSDGGEELSRILESARLRHRELHDWETVARLLELELALIDDGEEQVARLLELAQVYDEELRRSTDALAVYERAAATGATDGKVEQAIGGIRQSQQRWQDTVQRRLEDAEAAEDAPVSARKLAAAADAQFRFGGDDNACHTLVVEHLERALAADASCRSALGLAAVVYARSKEWTKLAEVLARRVSHGASRDDKAAAAHRLAQVCLHHLSDSARAAQAYQQLLEIEPHNSAALAFLVDRYSTEEDWEPLIALYEDQLHAGGIKQEDEFGVWVQIAMLNWKTLDKLEAGEVYFEKVRRAQPSHSGMLAFFRELCSQREDSARLVSILTDAERALDDGDDKRAIMEEIASLAESKENARRAIEQYKTMLRKNPGDDDARAKLKKLYLQTESYNALVELYRQDLQRSDDDDQQLRISILRDIAAVYDEHMRSDTALLTVLSQILQIDDEDIEAVRGLIRVYESLNRWRDLLNMQQRLAELTSDEPERIDLLRAVARRWLEQFSNVQNAIRSYERLLEVTGDDDEAREKLIELYRKRRAWPKLYDLYEHQLEVMDDEARQPLMVQMAKLAAERLDRGADAVRLLKEVLVFDSQATGVLDQLERQAERQKDYPTVAEVLERRIQEADDEKTKLALLQKLGVLQAEKLDDAGASNRAWRRVLDVSPGHKRALRVLRKSYVAEQDWDGLEELYRSQGDVEGLADFLSTTADRSKEPDEKTELSFLAARVYTDDLEAPERAVRSYERVLSIDASNLRAAEALLPLYEKEEKWSRLPGLYTILLEVTREADDKIAILHKIADVMGGPLANKGAALQHARQAYELKPDQEGLAHLRAWSKKSGDWTAFVDVVRQQLESSAPSRPDASGEPDEVGDVLGASRRRELELMLAEVYASETDKLDEAVAIYRRIVKDDPNDGAVMSDFEELLRSADRREDLRWLFGLKVDRLAGDERLDALEEWATVEEECFAEPERATELLRRVVEAEPGRVSSLSALSRLLIAAGQHAEAIRSLKAQRDVAYGDDRLQLEIRLAEISLHELDDPREAYQACVRALDIDEQHDLIVNLLGALLDRPETRPEVASHLERIYAAKGMSAKQAVALRAMLETEKEPAERLILCQRLADVHERELADPGAAFDVILNTLMEASDEGALWDRAAELGAKTGRPTDLAEAYREHVGGEGPSELPESLQLELSERAAELHEDKLGDADGAIPYLNRILTLDATHEGAFGRLKQTLISLERWPDLESAYARAIKHAGDDSSRIERLLDAAMVAEEVIGEDERAIGYYRRIIELDKYHAETLLALERLYARQERFGDLAGLLDSRLDACTDDDALVIHLQLVDLYLHSLDTPHKAVVHLKQALAIRPDDNDARELAEECLDIASLRVAAARLLDSVYEARDDIRALVGTLEIRLEEADNDAERRELLGRMATLRDERLKDDRGAFDALCLLLPLDADDSGLRAQLTKIGHRLGRYEEMAQALRATADNAGSTSLRGEILTEAANMLLDRLERPEEAEAVYRSVVALDEDDPELVLPACRALQSIYDEREDFARLTEVLATQARLESHDDVRRTLHQRIGQIYEEQLNLPDKAIEAYKAQFGDDMDDVAPLISLERLYEETEAWQELADTLRQLEERADDGPTRRGYMVKAAEVLTDHLDAGDEAIAAWRGVLDDFGPDGLVLGALVDLYEDAERWDDLVEALKSWLDLSKDEDERIELLASVGDVRSHKLDDPDGALEAFRDVLAIDPANEEAREAMAEMLSHDAAHIKRQVAATLGPLYEADGDAEQLLKVREIEVDCSEDPNAKLQILSDMMRTVEDGEDGDERAFAYACRGVREAVAEPSLGDWMDHVERLAAASQSWRGVFDLYVSVVDDVLDADVQQSVRIAAAKLARDRLDDAARSIQLFEAALEAEGEDRDAMQALEALYEDAADHEALLGVLRRLAETADGHDRPALLFRMGALQAGPLNRRDDAIDTYEKLADEALSEEAAAELERLYREAGRHDDVASLLERQLDGAVGMAQLELRIRFARLLLDDLGDTLRALDELGEALESDQDNEEAIAMIEKVLSASQEPDERGLVAEMLEPVYLRVGDWEKLQHVLTARIECSQDPGDRKQLLRRLATLQEEQLEDYSSALDAVASLLRDEPGDASLWREVERLGPLTGDDYEQRVAEIFVVALEQVGADDPSTADMCSRTGELFDIVDDKQQALKWYARAFEFSPDSDDLFGAIDELLTELGRNEERVEHYRAATDRSTDDDFRVAALGVIAEIYCDDLARFDDAIDTYREVLDIDPRDAVTLDSLTVLYKRQARRDDLIELYALRSEQAEEPADAAAHQLNLARLLAEEPGARDEALDQWQLIVDAQPEHAEAIADLEGLLEAEEALDRKQRLIDMLRPLYQGTANWQGLVALNSASLELVNDPMDKVALLHETARLWEVQGEDGRRAFDLLRQAFRLTPDDEGTREEFQRLADEIDAWSELAQSYAEALESIDDEAVQRELWFTLAAVYDEVLDDPRRALEALSQLTTLDPDDEESLERTETLSTLLSDWGTLAEVLEKKAGHSVDEQACAILWLRIGSVRSDMLDNRDGAIAAFERAVEQDPNSTLGVDRLIALHQEPEHRPERAALLEQRIDITPEDVEERHELIVQAADCYRELGQASDAIRMLQLALDARVDDTVVLHGLETLYRAEGLQDELLENLKMQASVSADADKRIVLRNKIGDLYVSDFDNSFDALDQYRLVLEEKGDDEHALKAVRRIADENDDLRQEVAALLDPVLSELGRYDELVDVMKLRLSAQTDTTERVQTLRGMALVAEEQLDDPEQARGFLLDALSECPDSDAIHDDVFRLCELIEDFQPYAEAIERAAGETYDSLLQAELYERLGIIAEEELDNQAMAIDAYRKAAEQTAEPNALLEALDRLYLATGKHQELAGILERRAEVESDDGFVAELYHRLAVLRIDTFGDKKAGLQALHMAVDCHPEHDGVRQRLEALTDDQETFEECAEALEIIYRVAQDKDARTALRNKRIEHAPTVAERVRLRIALAQMLEDETFDTQAAQAVIERALLDDVSDPELVSQVERLAAINAAGTEGDAAWRRAADSVTKAVEAGLAATSEGRGDVVVPPELARELYLYVAAWQRDHLRELDKAEQSLAAALGQEPHCVAALTQLEELQREPGREIALVGTLRRLAELADQGEVARESSQLRREAKVMAETVLEDARLVETILREMLVADEGDDWALRELAEVCDKSGKHEELYQLLLRQLETASDPLEQRELRLRAAAIARESLSDNSGALDLYEQAFEEDPDDEVAAAALRSLYPELDRYEDMLRFLERMIAQSSDSAVRVPLLLESATICMDRLEAPTEAIENLNAALLEAPGHAEAVRGLLRLLEAEGRDDERAEVLMQQIDLSRERGDREAELDYRLRAAELYETTLNDIERAVDSYLAVLDAEAGYRPALEALARLYEQEAQYADAAEMYEQLIEGASSQDDARVVLKASSLYRQIDDGDAMIRVLAGALERAADMSPSDRAEVEDALVSVYREQEQWLPLADLIDEQAERSLDADERLVLYRRAAEIHAKRREDYPRAAEIYEKALAVKSEDRGLMLTLSDAYTASGQVAESIAVLERLVASYHGRRSKELAEVHHRIAQAHLNGSDDVAALGSLKAARKIDPGSIRIQHQLGLLSIRLYDDRDDEEECAMYLKQANDCFTALLMQRLDGEDVPVSKAEVFFHLAQVKHRDGDTKQAIQKLERALANDRSLTAAQELLDELKG